MAKHIRIRCPVCGILSWQSRLDKKWQFEIVLQDIKGKGRGHGFSNVYSYPETEEGVWLLKLAMIDKLEVIIDDLKGELREEKGQIWKEKFFTGQYDEARLVNTTHHADFSTVVTTVHSLSGADLTVVLMPTRITKGMSFLHIPTLVAVPFLQPDGIESTLDLEAVEETVSDWAQNPSVLSELDVPVDGGAVELGSELPVDGGQFELMSRLPIDGGEVELTSELAPQGVRSKSKSLKGDKNENFTQGSVQSRLV